MNPYFDKKKREMFPKIDDWTKEPNEYIKGKSVAQMSYKEWFWFHPSAFNLVAFGSDIIGMLIFASMVAYFIRRGIILLALFISALFCFYLWSLIKRINKIKIYKTMTFYDLYLRER